MSITAYSTLHELCIRDRASLPQHMLSISILSIPGAAQQDQGTDETAANRFCHHHHCRRCRCRHFIDVTLALFFFHSLLGDHKDPKIV